MITLFCSCLAARLDIYTVKTLVNEELVCHWSCVGNKADHSISLSLSPPLSLYQSFLLLSQSSFLYTLTAPLHLHPSFMPVLHFLIALCV